MLDEKSLQVLWESLTCRVTSRRLAPLIGDVDRHGRGGCLTRRIGRNHVEYVSACHIPPARIADAQGPCQGLAIRCQREKRARWPRGKRRVSVPRELDLGRPRAGHPDRD